MSRKSFYANKLDLFKEYEYPKPLPTDYFLRLPDGSPAQSYLVLGQKGTGMIFC